MDIQNKILDKQIGSLCKTLEQQFDVIPEERKQKLLLLSQYMLQKFSENRTPNLTVICTHNSRRSHIGQIWLATGADYYKLPEIQTFSGGTEATAFNPRAVQAMQRLGFEISTSDPEVENPRYHIRWKKDMAPYPAFSKKYEDPPNPTSAFAAIMVCSQADEGCPVVLGSDFRLSLPYDDPKNFDDTNLEKEKYDERAKQIGTEILFALSQIRLN